MNISKSGANQIKKRKSELSLMNIFFCLTVIFIHINSEAVNMANRSSIQYAAVYILWQAASFVVYGFVFLSGIRQFINLKSKFNVREFYVKRMETVLVPYLIWVVFYYIFDCVTHVEVYNLHNLIYYMYSGDYIGHFYFVIIILQLYLLMPLWVWLFKKVHPMIMIPAALIITIIFGRFLPNVIDVFKPGYYYRFADRAFTTYFVYWAAGAYIGMNYDKAKKIIRDNRIFIYVTFAIMAVFALGISYYGNVNNKVWAWTEDLLQCYRITAIVTIFAASCKEGVSETMYANQFMKYLDLSCYNIYLCHCLIIKEVNNIFMRTGIDSLSERYMIRAAAVYVFSIGLCVLYTVLKTRIRFGPTKRNIS